MSKVRQVESMILSNTVPQTPTYGTYSFKYNDQQDWFTYTAFPCFAQALNQHRR